MPTISHDANTPNSGDLNSMEAQTGALATHLAQLSMHFYKLPTVNPGPPGSTAMADNINKIVMLAKQVQATGEMWLAGTQTENP
jgi:hypothetical protein